MLSERDKMLQAAAYLQGLARGLAVRATKKWHQEVRRSPLGTTKVFGTVDEIMRDGLASNPLLVYEMRNMAELCGYGQRDTSVACESITLQLSAKAK